MSILLVFLISLSCTAWCSLTWLGTHTTMQSMPGITYAGEKVTARELGMEGVVAEQVCGNRCLLDSSCGGFYQSGSVCNLVEAGEELNIKTESKGNYFIKPAFVQRPETTVGVGSKGDQETVGGVVEGEKEIADAGAGGEQEPADDGTEGAQETAGAEGEQQIADAVAEGGQGTAGAEGAQETVGAEGEQETEGSGTEEANGIAGDEGEQETAGTGAEGEQETNDSGAEGEQETAGAEAEGADEAAGDDVEEETAGTGGEDGQETTNNDSQTTNKPNFLSPYGPGCDHIFTSFSGYEASMKFTFSKEEPGNFAWKIKFSTEVKDVQLKGVPQEMVMFNGAAVYFDDSATIVDEIILDMVVVPFEVGQKIEILKVGAGHPAGANPVKKINIALMIISGIC